MAGIVDDVVSAREQHFVELAAGGLIGSQHIDGDLVLPFPVQTFPNLIDLPAGFGQIAGRVGIDQQEAQLVGAERRPSAADRRGPSACAPRATSRHRKSSLHHISSHGTSRSLVVIVMEQFISAM